MTDHHPITPPPELRSKWFNEAPGTDLYDYIIEQAARWGADQELDACCKVFESNAVCGTKFQRRSSVRDLRDKRRPKPPTLKEQALEVVTGLEKRWDLQCDLDTIRKALEALPND